MHPRSLIHGSWRAFLRWMKHLTKSFINQSFITSRLVIESRVTLRNGDDTMWINGIHYEGSTLLRHRRAAISASERSTTRVPVSSSQPNEVLVIPPPPVVTERQLGPPESGPSAERLQQQHPGMTPCGRSCTPMIRLELR